MPKIINTAAFRAKLKVYMVVAAILASVGLFSLLYWTSKTSKDEAVAQEFVQKNIVNKYVCKVIAADPDEDIFAVECLTK